MNLVRRYGSFVGLAGVLAGMVALCSCSQSAVSSTATKDRINYVDLIIGTSQDTVAVGDSVTVLYVGKLTNGTEFDSSFDQGGFPLACKAGGVANSGVITGFSQGLVGMRRGGKREVVIPPSLGYGSQGQGIIPGGATLIFDLTLVRNFTHPN